MNVEVEELSPCQKKLKIQLSAEEVNKEYQTVIQDFRKNVIIPGFRKGKASISTIKRRFSREIKDEVKEKLLEHSLKEALVQQEISPIGTPTLDVKQIKVTENKPIEYDVEVEFIPTIEITDYKGIEITKPSVGEVQESSITKALRDLQRQNAINEPVDDDYRISENDSVTVNYRRILDGESFGEPAENQTVWLASDSVLSEFRQHMIGRQKGDQVEFSVQYEEDAQDKTLAGKRLEFIVNIVDVEKVTLPDIDDEFAKDLEEDSLDALKKKLEQRIKEQLEQDAIAATKNQILMKLAETHVFEIPPSLIKEQKKKYPDKEEEEIKKMLRAGIILSKIQIQENISVTDEEVEATIERIATQHQMPVATMKGYLTQHGGLERIHADMMETKTLDFLYENAQLTEGK
jgi:trigger factor